MSIEGRTFTTGELSQYDGKGGAPAFFAYRGLVYDVTRSFLWQHGKHQVTHFAGCDHSGNLGAAPHGEDLLKRFAVVGSLVDESPDLASLPREETA